MGFEQYEMLRAGLIQQPDGTWSKAGGKPKGAVTQRAVSDEPLGKEVGEEGNPARIHVRVRSFRRRLIDPDNLCPKYFIDCLRYAGIIPNDRQADIILTVEQQKSKNERTVIDITPL